jgi:photosystem II stability/assembly factor-like uncharacterized protein
MAWQRLTTSTGGTVAALTRASSVLAATPIGVFRSADEGRTWELPATTRTVPFAEALAIADGDVIFVGARDGLYRSRDGGERWQHVLTGSAILGVASAVGLVVVATEEDGVLRSEDNGQSWSGANAGLLDLTALSVALSPCFELDHTGFVGTASGLYRTRNGARSWRAVETGVEDAAVQCAAISPDFAHDRLIVVGTESNGLLWSADGGASWEQALEGGVTAFAFAPDGVLAAATDSGIAVSSDAARTWCVVGSAPGAVLSLVFAKDSLLAGLDRFGVARSADNGATWRLSDDGLQARVATAIAANRHGLFEASLEDGIRGSTDRGKTWRQRNRGLEDANVLGLTANDQMVYAITSAGLYHSRDGVAWDPYVLPAPPAGELLALAPTSENVLFVATRTHTESVVWRSADAGHSWQRWLAEPATNLLPLACGAGDAVFAGSGSRVLHTQARRMWRSTELDGATAVTALATAPQRTVLAGTDAGVYISHNGGQTFTCWGEGLTPRGVVALAVAEAEAYALTLGGSVWRRQLRDE